MSDSDEAFEILSETTDEDDDCETVSLHDKASATPSTKSDPNNSKLDESSDEDDETPQWSSPTAFYSDNDIFPSLQSNRSDTPSTVIGGEDNGAATDETLSSEDEYDTRCFIDEGVGDIFSNSYNNCRLVKFLHQM